MFFISSLVAASKSSILDHPIDPINGIVADSLTHITRAEFIVQSCTCPNSRGVLDIVWSCLSTIFLCTWVAMHPNMPSPSDKGLYALLRRVKLMLSAIVGPELILLLSMRQWLAARQESKKYQKYNWKMAHGYFLNMGGFVLMKGDEDLGVVSCDLFQRLHDNEDIEFPTVTEEELKDRSKGDPLSKAIVILQTLWFVIQCIGRRVEGLALTELEIVTLAFCSLNGAMYFLWWNKPLDVRCRIPLYLKPGSDYAHEPAANNGGTERSSMLNAEPLSNQHNVTIVDDELGGARSHFQPVRQSFQNTVHQIKTKWQEGDTISRLVMVIVILPAPIIFLVIFSIIIVPLMVIQILINEIAMRPVIGVYELAPGRSSVHTYYAPGKRKNLFMMSFFGITGALSGGIHCIAWNFHFPTHFELHMWRFLSVFIVCVPIFFPFYVLAARALKGLAESMAEQRTLMSKIVHRLSLGTHTVLLWILVLSHTLFAPARLALLVQSLVSLRSLTPTALLDIDWQNFVPHF